MNEKTYLTKDEILGMDIELSNVCNLKCPLCLSQFKEFDHVFKKHFIDLEFLKQRISEFKNLKLLSFAGDASEPTLYPHLIELLDWLKDKDIFVELYSNAMTHDDKWWVELPNHLSKQSKIIFTICGTTQELHEKYRVGSDLETVLRHARIFRDNTKNENDHMQYICFEYNKNDSIAKRDSILNEFSEHVVVETDPIYERFHLNEKMREDGICSEKMFGVMYKVRLKKLLEKKHLDLDCYSFYKRYIRMDNFGVLSPCVCYKLYQTDNSFEKGDILDYSDIMNNKFDFCYECDKDFSEFLNNYNRDAFYMC